MEIYVFDGTLEGLLTAVFDSYERKAVTVKLVSAEHYLPDVFQENYTVISEDSKAKRVWSGLRKKLDADWMKNFYKSFLSEQPETFQDLFDFAQIGCIFLRCGFTSSNCCLR